VEQARADPPACPASIGGEEVQEKEEGDPPEEGPFREVEGTTSHEEDWGCQRWWEHP